MAVKPVTEDVLRTFLAAHGVQLPPGADVSATASNVLANFAAQEAAQRANLCSDPKAAEDQKLVLTTAEHAVRKNPFVHASGSHK